MSVDDYKLFLGIDLGTSGVRISIINELREQIYSDSKTYENKLENCNDWVVSCSEILNSIPLELKAKAIACSIAGTSGTLLACNFDGKPLGNAIAYYTSFPKKESLIRKYIPLKSTACNINSSFARALHLTDLYGLNIKLRHQADWVSGWLTNNWEYGEEGNNLRLGWDLNNEEWPESFKKLEWFNSLPKIVRSGQILSKISPCKAKEFGLPRDLLIVSGTTDSNAAVLAANPKNSEGVTILGSTIVLKSFVDKPINSMGISNHRIGKRWLLGGASNAGGAILKKFFSDQEIEEISNQINPRIDSGIKLVPLLFRGERFPYDDPYMMPVLNPRPISDCIYLQALLEGLTKIELDGWKKLQSLGVPSIKKIITIGGGSKNLNWQKLRQRKIGIPIIRCKNPPAMGAAILALKALIN